MRTNLKDDWLNTINMFKERCISFLKKYDGKYVAVEASQSVWYGRMEMRHNNVIISYGDFAPSISFDFRYIEDINEISAKELLDRLIKDYEEEEKYFKDGGIAYENFSYLNNLRNSIEKLKGEVENGE